MVSDGIPESYSVQQLLRLNPCSNGIWSLTVACRTLKQSQSGLNPCSNGIWSLTVPGRSCPAASSVLILVLMEYGL